MPRETGYDWYQWWEGSAGRWSVPTRVLNADIGTSPAPAAPAEPATLQLAPDIAEWMEKWDGKKVIMKTVDGETREVKLKPPPPTLEEKLKHMHNPRGLNASTTPPLPFFQKELPTVGQRDVWVRFAYMGWDLAYCQPVEILENDEQTVYFKGKFGIEGYICSCKCCQDGWTMQTGPGWATEWTRIMNGSSDWGGASRRGSGYQRQYFGHLGSIQRAFSLGLRLSVDGSSPGNTLCHINHSRRESRYGLLLDKASDEVTWAVPTFIERTEPLPTGAAVVTSVDRAPGYFESDSEMERTLAERILEHRSQRF